MKELLMKHATLLVLIIFGSVCSAGAETYAVGKRSESIGYYTAGCIRNSVALPTEGPGYQVIRLGRGRYYAHPEMVDYIAGLSAKVKERLGGLLLIADISQYTGGPMPDDHSSHQIGLDADILFWQHPVAKVRTLKTPERETIHPRSVLTANKYGIDDTKWKSVHGQILYLAASDPRVDRIFVNPLIKQRLCEWYGGQQWLGKIRPWYGHDGHFHVRLGCPEGNGLCEPQKPINSSGDGCGEELMAWFTTDGKQKERKKSKPKKQRELPAQCKAIMDGGIY